jgi:uncharacterized protein
MQKTINRDYQSLFRPMIASIETKVHLKAVILFGSRARNQASIHSDFDLVFIGDFSMPYHRRVSMVLLNIPAVPVDAFCYTPDEFEEMFSSFNVTAIDAIGDGIVLLGASFVEKYKRRYDDFVKHGMRKTTCTIVLPTPT